MVTEIPYVELGVNRGAVLPQKLSYNGAIQTLVDFNDGEAVARYDDGAAAVVILGHTEDPEDHEADDSE